MALHTFVAGDVLEAQQLNDSFAAVSGGDLKLISTTTIGTSVSSVTVSNAFSATYDNYRIVISGGVSTANAGLTVQFGATATGYYSSYFRALWGATTAVVATSNGTSGSFGVATPNFIHTSVDVLAPNLAKTTVWSGTFVEVNTTLASTFVGGYLNDTTQYTAFTIAGATMTGGSIRVYGYKN